MTTRIRRQCRKFPAVGSCLAVVVVSQSLFAAVMPGYWVVVSPPAYRAALEPLIEHRRAEGFRVEIVQTGEVKDSARADAGAALLLQKKLREVFEQAGQGPRYLLLAGCAETVMSGDHHELLVPGLTGKTGRMKDGVSDAGYGMPETDGMPRVAVGRFPARDVQELQGMVEKTLHFERETKAARWRNRLFLLLGNPGGGPLAEMFVNQTLNRDLGSLDPVWEARTLFRAASSRYFLPPPSDQETAIQYFEGGQIFSVYLGHSAAAGMGLDGKFLTCEHWAKLKIPAGGGPLFTCGCFALESSSRHGEAYGLVAMRNPAGPVAVIGASGETYSAPGQLAAEGLLRSLSKSPFPQRLGDYWLEIQEGLARGKMDQGTFTLLDMADGTGGKVPLATQRLEHLEMWMLLGDPALHMPLVSMDVVLKDPQPTLDSKFLVIKGTVPGRLAGAALRVTLERPLNSPPGGLQPLPPASAETRDERFRKIHANFESANSFVLAVCETNAVANGFSAVLQVPERFPGTNLVVRARAERDGQEGMGILKFTAQRLRR